jgi:hypothetical protein
MDVGDRIRDAYEKNMRCMWREVDESREVVR